ncbi:N-acetyltransferase GCN5 [Deinococcus grandis]|uniref:N-acetyltransferase GCN5 n=1 Tax=Deinococcus grandis TaxID=57498 RepID=A0A100HGR5_9DEIO|nr:N-acetyltransferase [Deinococcus grandis]GAQ20227.1 N-acetyltransferase GCN5 [Deinococcus grandis]
MELECAVTAPPVTYRVREWPDLPALGGLRSLAWGGADDGSRWAAVLTRSLIWVTAHDGARLVGFVNVAWDGGAHAFLLDTTVRPDWQRRGVGTRLVQEAIRATRAHVEVEWLHVDFEAHLTAFYAACGFTGTSAGLLRL